MHEAKTRLSELVKLVEEGEEVVIERRGKPVARLMPVGDENGGIASAFGVWRGKVQIADDFDELPDDVAEEFGMR
jgi:prevent-host-death family protein